MVYPGTLHRAKLPYCTHKYELHLNQLPYLAIELGDGLTVLTQQRTTTVTPFPEMLVNVFCFYLSLPNLALELV